MVRTRQRPMAPSNQPNQTRFPGSQYARAPFPPPQYGQSSFPSNQQAPKSFPAPQEPSVDIKPQKPETPKGILKKTVENLDVPTEGEKPTNTVSGEKKDKPLPPWMRAAIDGVKIKKKKRTPAERHRSIRKWISPKNALMCLNEIKSDHEYNIEFVDGKHFRASLQVNGGTYQGLGSSKSLAKQAAAENALKSFVTPNTLRAFSKNPTVPVPAEQEEPSEDTTPWMSLASFAIYKLFNEWKEKEANNMNGNSTANNVAWTGVPGSAPNVAVTGQSFPMAAYPPQAFVKPEAAPVQPLQTAFKVETPQPLNPAKQFPKNAAELHPMMLLNQQRPDVHIEIEQKNINGELSSVATAIIDGQTFVGQATNKKNAKLELARSAVKGLFSIDSVWKSPVN